MEKEVEETEENESSSTNSKFEKKIGFDEFALTRKEIMEIRGYK